MTLLDQMPMRKENCTTPSASNQGTIQPLFGASRVKDSWSYSNKLEERGELQKNVHDEVYKAQKHEKRGVGKSGQNRSRRLEAPCTWAR